MKTLNKGQSILIVACILLLGCSTVFGDTIVMSGNRLLKGSAIQTNEDDVLILTRYAAFNFSKASIKEIKTEPAQVPELSGTNRIPDFNRTVLFLSQQSWTTNLAPIPATVIDTGILRNVPYNSFRCGGDYEVNLYGDLENPAGIEIGVYHGLSDDNLAKDNCIKFITNLLNQPADKEIVRGLDRSKDLKTLDDLTFEITPSTAEDAYHGWWVSVYSQKQLNRARAPDSEMQLISMTQAEAAKDAQESTNLASWSADELKTVRPWSKSTISFYNTSGLLITNAEVVRVIDGVSLIWRDGPTSGGMIRLADLPENLRTRFGYDETKTKVADELAKEDQARRQEANAAAQAASAQSDSSGVDYLGYSGLGSSGDYSGGGSVYVHGYYRRNGTYVNSYTRSSPHRH